MTGPVLGHLTDISLGGCFVKTSVLMSAGTRLKLVFSMDDGKLQAEGTVLRLDPGTGVAVSFGDVSRGDRANIQQVMEYVQHATAAYDNRYFAKLRELSV